MSAQKKSKKEDPKPALKQLLSKVKQVQKQIDEKLEDISRTCREVSKEI